MSYSSYKIGKNTVRCKDTQTGISYTVDFNRPLKSYFISGDNITGTMSAGEDGPVISIREVTYDIKTGRTIDSNCWTEPNYEFERKRSISRSNSYSYSYSKPPVITNSNDENITSSLVTSAKNLAIFVFVMYILFEILKLVVVE